MTTRRKRFRSPRWALEIRQRLRRLWTLWLQKRTARRLARAVQRHRLLLLEVDNQLLLIKELELREQDLAHRQVEMQEAQQFRLEGLLPPEPQHLTEREQLDQLLWGASNPPA